MASSTVSANSLFPAILVALADARGSESALRHHVLPSRDREEAISAESSQRLLLCRMTNLIQQLLHRLRNLDDGTIERPFICP